MTDNKKDPSEMTIKEFMEWFVSEYDGYWLPGEIDPCLHRLEGYCIAKQGTEEHAILYASLQNLRNFSTLLRVVKQHGKWMYRPPSP